MNASLVSTTSLMYLLEVFNEIKENGDSNEIDDAIEMINGLLNESVRLSDLAVESWLQQNENMIKSLESEDA